MEALSGKELDDSIFNTDSHIDWAEESNTLDILPLPQAGSYKTDSTTTTNNNRRGSRDSSSYAGGSSRGNRQSSRSNQKRKTSKTNNTDNGNATMDRRSYSRSSRMGGGRSSSRNREPRSSSINNRPQLSRNDRARDRSRSIDRPFNGGMDAASRRWRGSSVAGAAPAGGGGSNRSRADTVDRWEHDKFESTNRRSHERRNSAANIPSVRNVGIEHIGKEGISCVTINRRESNPSAPVPSTHSGGGYNHSSRPRRMSKADSSAPPSSSSQRNKSPYRTPHQRQGSVDYQKPDDVGKDNDSGSCAELEWENFVANGGLDIPIDSITDELLKQQRQQKGQQQQKRKDEKMHTEEHYMSPRNRVDVLLNNDNDDEGDDEDLDSAYGRGSKCSNVTAAAASSGKKTKEQQQNQGIAIRGTAKAANSNRRPSVPSNAHLTKNSRSPPTAPVDSLGIRIKGTSTSSSKPPVSPRISPAANTALRRVPSQPETPGNRSRSRSSSTERQVHSSNVARQGATPSSYPRRQFEGYDEDRGRHLFSVNLPYDEHRSAPIHVHERDDIQKLAAKFCRTWRVHPKELRIKQLLIKMKSLMVDSPI